MKQGIQVYGFLVIFCFSIIIIVELLGLSINYKTNNEINALLIEIIEVNDGYDQFAEEEITKIKQKYQNAEIIINKHPYMNEYNYEIIVSTKFTIKLINLNIPIQTIKYTRQVKV